ncbi:PF09912 family protein [Leptospira yanagawae serovar Saopaulo str. Sao Paulo = ATCC 700523]|uniref:PF09912 family protein n=1 Tax=Leptospira yanagawae serovar Saopaulo str. Sao Paulo = ATCC 700523 TaxID=1249483 RepID=A0A5E8HAU2_9LEPT|nr:DUF2141 domain-containing protein [Leptospira yanagawae]EOQ87760.1 PF09912 family protein [Leptospira yanagawae serovar Saopaulo str. Sao Paulo = ATCC 700523]
MEDLKKYLWLVLLFPIVSVNALDLEVEILNRKSKQSVIRCGIFVSQEGFPSDEKKAVMRVLGVESNQQKTICNFKGLQGKLYAVSVLEDINANGKMETTFVGFPKEPWGVSNDAPMHPFGPPTFEEAGFLLKSNLNIQIKLNQ